MQSNETPKDQFAKEVTNRIEQALKDYKDKIEKVLSNTNDTESK